MPAICLCPFLKQHQHQPAVAMHLRSLEKLHAGVLRLGQAKQDCRTRGFTPVTEQPMMRPCRRTPRYHLGPMRLMRTLLKPALVNHCRHRGACHALRSTTVSVLLRSIMQLCMVG